MVDLYVGLISGTSMDGIDAVVVGFGPGQADVRIAITQAFDSHTRAELDRVRRDPDHYPVADLARLDARMGSLFAEAALQAIDQAGLKASDIRAIGSHGQTIIHRAGPAEPCPYSLQIGDPHRIAALTGIPTVSDFRRPDVAAGGQGAPLAPLIHQALLASPDETRAVANLGGIANITLLPTNGPVLGFDTGPANCFLDAWYRRHHPDRYDRDGSWAASGRVDADWLDGLMNDSYFGQPAPKSTGIEYFSIRWLDQRLPAWARQRPADIQATLAEFSARSLCEALNHASPLPPARVLVCGGGVHNRDLIERIARLGSWPVQSSADFGLDPDAVEAVLFAWLARKHLAGEAIDTRTITGAHHRVQAGMMARPPG
jgi:anhydro-N-acetylmuramic acid kinase